MKITVITPSLNSSLFISKCLTSVANQQNCEIEHLIIDGGSSDDTIVIAQRFNAKVIVEQGSSIYEANNLGIKNATGDIICFLNSDDYYHDPLVLFYAVQFFQLNHSVDVLYGNTIFVDGNSKYLYLQKAYRNPSYWLTKKAIYILSHPATFFRRELFAKYGLYDTQLKYSADLEYILRLMNNKVKFKYVNYDFATFTRHNANRSSDPDATKDFRKISDIYKVNYNAFVHKLFLVFVNLHNLDYLLFTFKRKISRFIRSKRH